MRILQNLHLYPQHIAIIDALEGPGASHDARVRAMVREGLNGCHILEPCALGSPDAFLTATADAAMQRAWAIAHGMKADTNPHAVLLAQIEDFKPDVVYSHGSGYFPEHVRRAIKSLTKVAISWKAPPDFTNTLDGFDMGVNNFPSSFPRYEAMGMRMGYFSPSFDVAMEPECDAAERPIDIVFVGGYSRHHRNRAQMLDQIAALSDRYTVQMALLFDKAARVANTPLGLLPGLSRYRASGDVRAVSVPPLFGRDMYRLFSKAKIIVNNAIDVSGGDRGNIRCFEALGCGALMLSDSGIYPDGMADGQTMVTYDRMDQIPALIASLLADDTRRTRIAAAGQHLLRTTYGQAENWRRFQALAERCI